MVGSQRFSIKYVVVVVVFYDADERVVINAMV